MKEITIGSTFTQESVVTHEQIANAVGSGSVHVYATPMMIALMEQTAVSCLATFLDAEETSVGVSIATTHDAATPVGMKVFVTAKITAVDRKKVTFQIDARDEKDSIGSAIHERVIVNQEKFEARANAKLTS